MKHDALRDGKLKQAKLKQAIKISTIIGLVSVGLGMGLSGCTTLQSQSAGASTDYYGVPATERTLAQRILDRSIRNTALQNINGLDPTLHRRSRISVDSFYSNVLLTGEVPDDITRQHIVNLVSAMPDVKNVHNALNVTANKGVSYTVHDGYITSKINTKILQNPLIRSSQVKVVTDDGVVYVLGKLTPTQRGHLMNIVDSTVGVKKLILLTDLIDDNGLPIDESLVTQEAGLAPPVYTIGQPEYNDTGVYNNVGNHVPVYTIPPTSTSTPPSNTVPVQPTQPTMPSTPTSPTVPVDTDGNSPYIELYKDDVPGW